jgi:hypothetical protein
MTRSFNVVSLSKHRPQQQHSLESSAIANLHLQIDDSIRHQPTCLIRVRLDHGDSSTTFQIHYPRMFEERLHCPKAGVYTRPAIGTCV